jgi:hypothetical protein
MPTSYLTQITQPNTQQFLMEHEDDDAREFVLKQKEVDGIPSSILATQLIGRRKAKSKLATWYKTKGVIYAPSANMEQSSSEATAVFKSNIINARVSPKQTGVDLTGGMGVDSFFLSQWFESFHYVEPSADLIELAKHNHQQLGATHIMHHCLTAEKFIEQTNLNFDLVYIDPSRRDEHSRKVYKLADCSPDISSLQPIIVNKGHYLLIKASPLLDIQQGLREIDHVKNVYVVSVGNECKELLFLADRDYVGEPQIEAVDLFENGNVLSSFTFTIPDEQSAYAEMGNPEKYLYEPNASIMKSGAFKLISARFGLIKLDVNTHLYTSSALMHDFPGRVFQIECLNPDTAQLKLFLPEAKVNVVSRNYPLTPDQIKKKLRLRDGGDKFLIGFSSSKKKWLALCSRITNI